MSMKRRARELAAIAGRVPPEPSIFWKQYMSAVQIGCEFAVVGSIFLFMRKFPFGHSITQVPGRGGLLLFPVLYLA
jgi:hypothetical protein